MIKNRELALIPDSALELVEAPPTAPVPGPRSSTNRGTRDASASRGHPPPASPERTVVP